MVRNTGSEAVLTRVEQIVDDLPARGGAERPVRGVGAGAPGRSFSTGLPVAPPIVPGWGGYEIRERLSRHHDAPTWVDNDVDPLALGELRCNPAADADTDLLSVAFTPLFRERGTVDRVIYVTTVVLGAAATGSLIAPVSIHRFLSGRRMKDEVAEAAGRLMVCGMVLLALTIGCTLLLVLRFVVPGVLSEALACGVMPWFGLCWYVLPLRLRRRPALPHRGRAGARTSAVVHGWMSPVRRSSGGAHRAVRPSVEPAPAPPSGGTPEGETTWGWARQACLDAGC